MKSMAIIAYKIAKVLSTQTPAQIEKHAKCFFKQNLKTNSAAVKRYWESLSPDRKAQVLVNDSAAHQKQRQSLSPENKTQILCHDADAHRKQRKSFSPKDKNQVIYIKDLSDGKCDSCEERHISQICALFPCKKGL